MYSNMLLSCDVSCTSGEVDGLLCLLVSVTIACDVSCTSSGYVCCVCWCRSLLHVPFADE